ncbi:energy transducer TonB [Novosphingobium sp. KA1]|uniref:energy transducer TonB n=1 Tax=Novosphingobium sp. (strain KA1) TaxID=164608 RepID=UPI001F5DD51F|nr:energy transducer TonB [Novosphingobium sp. KA1]
MERMPMSYVDRSSSSNHKFLTGGVVALIQAGAVLALINGLAVTMLKPNPGPRLSGEQISLTPPPPPPEVMPSPQPETRQVQDTVLTAPTPDLKLPTTSDFNVSSQPEGPVSTATGSAPGDSVVTPSPTPSPLQRFQPVGALPRGNPGNWVSTQDYPSADLRAEHQGLVRFRLDIDARGRVGQCTIVTSSGYSGLDEATCKNVSRRARFEPATDADGLTVGGTYMGTIRWVIPRD